MKIYFLDYFKINFKILIDNFLKLENINEENIFNILFNSYSIDFFVMIYNIDFINTLLKIKEFETYTNDIQL